MAKNNKEQEDNVELDDAYIPTPPDGGWGWVIVTASLLINIIVDGIGYAFGVFLPVFEDYFHSTKSKTSLIGSALCGVYLCSGPIASALVNKFGCRPVAMVGSVISTVAFVLSMFSPNVDILIVTYGGLGGFGFGLMYLPSIVSVGYYFEKKRALATGIAVCGSGVGTFLVAPFCEFLLSVYDWKNTALILAAIIFNGVAFGALMRPLEPPKVKKQKPPREKNAIDRIKETRKRQESENSQAASVILQKVRDAKLARQRRVREEDGSESEAAMYSVSRQNSVLASPSETGSPTSNISPEYPTPPVIIIDSVDDGPVSPDDVDVANGSKKNGLIPSNGRGSGDGITTQELEPLTGSVPIPQMHKVRRGSTNKKSVTQSLQDLWAVRPRVQAREDVIKKEDYARPMYRRDIFYSGSVANIHQFRSQPDIKSYITSITEIPQADTYESKCFLWRCPCLPKAVADTLMNMMDCSLLTEPSFILIILGNIVGMLGFYIPYVLTVSRAMSFGIDKGQAAFLLSIIGITNTIGRVVIGALSDHPKISALWVHNITLMITGVCNLFVPLCTTYVTLCIYAAVFGLFAAAYISLTSIILCDILGLERLTNAFGLLTLARGISSTLGPPVAGSLVDTTGSYDGAFYMSGGLFLLCALLHSFLLLPCIQRNKPPSDFIAEEDVEMEDVNA
ncbi:monocarboxylate transporter 12-like [Tubulanus polymorphus]|uniref:monocarboxylate transporter 12-like n=1 Tax=Tubulanus polymorphus TaxID=672921 RepID=UPI003DA3F00B